MYVVKLLGLILTIFFVVACNSDDQPTEEISQDPSPHLNVVNLTASIESPDQDRDFSYHNSGSFGVFENPDLSKNFIGSVFVKYIDPSDPIPNSDINISWRSSIDGILYEGIPNDTLASALTISLSKGIHTIYFEASISGTDNIVVDSLLLSNSIKLEAENTGKSVDLNWTKYNGNDFVSYLVYKESTNYIAEITNINTLHYEDTQSTSLIDEKQYQIVVKTSWVYPHVLGSNIVRKFPGRFIEFPYFVHKLIKDPIRPKVYAICKPRSNSDNADKYGIVILNTEGDLTIENHILINERYADIDISPSGQFLFICSEIEEKITRVDLNTLDIFQFPTDTNEWGIHKIEVGFNNMLVCHRDPPTSGNTQYWIYDGNNGGLLNGPTGVSRHGDIELDVENNWLFSGNSNSTSASIYKYKIQQNTLVFLKEFQYPQSFPAAHILLSEDKQRLYWEQFELNKNFDVMRVFNFDVKACSPLNNYLADFYHVYNFDSLEMLLEFPNHPSSEKTSVLFLDDNNLIFSRANSQVFPGEVTYFFKVPLF